MEEKERDELAKIQLDPATPSSMLQNGKYGEPDRATTEMLRVKQKNTEAKLKERQQQWDEQLKEITNLHLGGSSFLEEGAPDIFHDVDAKLKARNNALKEELDELGHPSSFLEEGAARPISLAE